MKTSPPIRRIAPFFVLALTACASTATSTSREAEMRGYATAEANQVVRTGTDECLHTAEWTAALASERCEPHLVARPAPTVAAADPEPAPPVAIVAPAVIPERPALEQVYVGMDTYFELNGEELTDQAQANLDRLIERTRGAEELRVQVVGYADRLGSEEYNQALSARRAEAVRNYLVEHGVPESAIETQARGASDPVLPCEELTGKGLVDCLRINRRAEIEVSALQPAER